MFEKLLSIILFIFIGFWLLGLIGRWFLRYWIVKKQRQMEEQMRNGGSPFQSFGNGRGFAGFYGFGGGNPAARGTAEKRPEGEIKVEKIKEEESHVNHKIGEYVEFEEVKE